jgi:hypothetical protein
MGREDALAVHAGKAREKKRSTLPLPALSARNLS